MALGPELSATPHDHETLLAWIAAARSVEAALDGPLSVEASFAEPESWVSLSPDHVLLTESQPGDIEVHGQAGRPFFALIEHSVVPHQDWSGEEFVSFAFRGRNSNVKYSVSVFFGDGVEDFATFTVADDFKGTRQVFLPIEEPVATKGTVDWARVSRIRIGSSHKGDDIEFALSGFTRLPAGAGASLFDRDRFDWLPIGGVTEAPDGLLRLPIAAGAEVDQLLLTSASAEEAPSPGGPFGQTQRARVLDYEKISPTRYEVRVQADEPFDLILAQGYHPLWRATLEDGTEVDATVSQGFLNGFHLPIAGQYAVTIEFVGQRYANWGLLVAASAAAVLLIFLVLVPRLSLGQRSDPKGGDN